MQYVGRYLALRAISFYQRFISPYKGFRCAYGHYNGCASCSKLAYRAIRMRGLRAGLGLLLQRFERCREVFERHREARVQGSMGTTRKATSFGPGRLQRGFCDGLDCIPCDADCASAACDILNNCGGCSPCDLWPPKNPPPSRRGQFVASR